MAVPTRVIVFKSDAVVHDKASLKQTIDTFAKSVWLDFKATNQATAGKAIKFGTSAAIGAPVVARELEAMTPARWILSGFGPLPAEFTKSGAIQVFEFTTVERALLVAKSAAFNFVLVTAMYEGGVLIGSVVNQTLSEKTKDAIGGTINEIVNEGGWRLLWQHPFGYGL